MGVDTSIVLPGDVRVADAAKVIGILAGQEKRWEETTGARWVEVEGVTVKSYDTDALVGCALIEFADHHVMWHFEVEHGKRLIMPRSTPFWLAVGKALVDFFGGTVDYQDCDATDVDYEAHTPRLHNDPEDDGPWDAFQQALYDIQPLTKADIKAMREHAAYQETP